MTELTPAASLAPAARPGRPIVWIYVVLSAAAIVEFFELNMMYVMLPRLNEVFGDPVQVTWAVTIFNIVGASSVAFGGRIGDIVGHRKVLIFALIASATGSFVSATATEIWQLILGRGIQGTAVIILPLALGVLRGLVASPDRTKFGTGIIAGISFSAAGFAPLTAGLLVSRFDWHSVFVVSGALAVVVLLLTLTLPASRGGLGSWRDVDVIGGTALIPGLVLILLALSQFQTWGLTSPLTLGVLLGGIVVLIGWWLYERRRRLPAVDVRLFTHRGFAVSCIAFVLYTMSLGTLIVQPTLAQSPTSVGGFGLSTVLFGVFQLPSVAMSVVLSLVAGWLTVRIGCRATLIIGGVVQGVGYAIGALILIFNPDRSLLTYLPFLLITASAIGIMNTVFPAFVTESIPKQETGMALGVQQLVKQAAQSVGQQGAAAILVAFPLVAAAAGTAAAYPAPESIHLVYLLAAGLCLLILPVALFAPRVARVKAPAVVPVADAGAAG